MINLWSSCCFWNDATTSGKKREILQELYILCQSSSDVCRHRTYTLMICCWINRTKRSPQAEHFGFVIDLVSRRVLRVAVLPFHFILFPLPLGSVFRTDRLIWRQKVLGAFSLPWHRSALREAQTRECSSIVHLMSIYLLYYLLCPRPIWCLVSTLSVMSTSLAPLTCFVMLGTWHQMWLGWLGCIIEIYWNRQQ